MVLIQGTAGNAWRCFLLSQHKVFYVTGIEWIETKDAAEFLQYTRTAPNIPNAGVEIPRATCSCLPETWAKLTFV